MTMTTQTETANSRIGELAHLLNDPTRDRATNLARLQGWRGEDLDVAVNAPFLAHRIGPIVCGLLALGTAVTGSALLLGITLATAFVGVFAPNHPAETLFNVWARSTDRQPLPPNRAAKRLGCALGAAFLAGAGLAWAVGATVVGNVLLVSLGALALFVAATGLCVPSMIYTLLFGAESGTRAKLIGA